MKKIILAILVSFVPAVQAATVSLTPSGNQVYLGTHGGEKGIAGDGAVLGYFVGWTGSATQLAALSDPTRGVLDYINQNFVPLGTSTKFTTSVSSGMSEAALTALGGNSSTVAVANQTVSTVVYQTPTGGVTGVNFSSDPANSVSSTGLPRGSRVFLLVFDDPSLQSATNLGIFSATTWTLGATATNLSLATTLINDAPTEAFRGTIGSLVLAPFVPEPGTASMGMLAALGLLARRRRA